ncbi:MAG: hypothetical protein Q3962_07140 [Corynebacterium sp.]|nr:hypothetical protein [Corynebacterium sp.]
MTGAIAVWLAFMAYHLVKFFMVSDSPSFGRLFLADLLPYTVLIAVIYGVYLLALRAKTKLSFVELFSR